MSLVEFVSTSIILCPNLTSNVTIAGHSLAVWNQSLSNVHPCGGNTYLRPDAGGALQPYPWTIFQILVHAPVCIVRLARFERVQIWSLTVATVNTAIAIQAYKSTNLVPEEVLVWTPVVLILDAGAMLQIYILVLEKVKSCNFLKRVSYALAAPFRALLHPLFRKLVSGNKQSTEQVAENRTNISNPILTQKEYDVEKSACEVECREVPTDETGDIMRMQSTVTITEANLETINVGTKKEITINTQVTEELSTLEATTEHPRNEGELTAIASLSLLILLFIILLQLVGLVKAVEGTQVSNLNATWCSPDFQPGALAVIDGNCNVRMLHESSSSGIGCVPLPGSQQKSWLVNTIVIVCLSLIFQFIDLCVLSLSEGKDKICYNKVKLQRPWLTTFAGMVILIVLASGGINYANSLPDGITARVLVLRRDESLGVFPVCEGRLVSPGLRGAIIGYFDGLLNSWGTWYYGKASIGNEL